MDPLLSLLSQPIVQGGGIVGILVALHKTGTIDVKALMRAALGLPPVPIDRSTIDEDNRNAMQKLLIELQGDMTKLSVYYNHETTGLLAEIRDSLKENFASIHAKHDEWDRRGIPTADCKK